MAMITFYKNDNTNECYGDSRITVFPNPSDYAWYRDGYIFLVGQLTLMKKIQQNITFLEIL